MSFQNLFNESNLNINLIIAVDNVSIDYNSTGQLEVKNGGISSIKLANLSVTNAKISDMDASKLTGTITIPIDNVSITTDRLITGHGSVVVPSITFKDDLSTGFSNPNPTQISFSSNGTEVMSLNNDLDSDFYGASIGLPTTISGALSVFTGNLQVSGGGYLLVSSPGNIRVGGGTVSAPSYCLGGSSSGMYSGGTETVSFSATATEVFRMIQTLVTCLVPLSCLSNVTVGGIIYNTNGTASAPSFTFTSDTDTGIYKNSAKTLSITSNSTEVARFNFSGNQMFVPLSLGSNSISCGALNASSLNISSGTAKGFVYLDATKNLVSTAATTNGQLLVGSTSGSPAAATLTGTTNQVTVTNGSNSITLALPQNIHTAATPTFGGAFINGTEVVGASSAIGTGANKLQVFGTDTSTSGPHVQFFTGTNNFPLMQILAWTHNNIALNFDAYFDGAWRSSSTTSNFQLYKLNDVFSINYFPGATIGSSIAALTTNQALTVNTAGQVGLPPLSAYSTLYLDLSKNITGSVLTNGQLLVGRTGNSVIAASITGTTNQVSVTNGSGTITLSLPQNIHTAATPTYGGAFLNGQTVVGNNAVISTGVQKLMVYGTDNSSSGPHIQTFTSADNYPLLQVLSQQHGNISLNLDAYYDGSVYRSSSTTSNYQIIKKDDLFALCFYAGATQGSNIDNIRNQQAVSIDTLGRVCLPGGTNAKVSSVQLSASGSLFLVGVNDSVVNSSTAGLSCKSTDNFYPTMTFTQINEGNISLTFGAYWDATSSGYRYSNNITASCFAINNSGNLLKILCGDSTFLNFGATFVVGTQWDKLGNVQNNLVRNDVGQPYINYEASTYASVTSGSATQLSLWNTNISTQGGMTITNSNTRITVPAGSANGGKYMCIAEVQFDTSLLDPGNRAVWWQKNTDTKHYGTTKVRAATGDATSIISQACITLAAGDYVSVYVLQNSGFTLHVGSLGTDDVSRITVTKIL